MKNTHTCPKCEGKEIVLIEGHTKMSGGGNYISVGLSALSNVPVNRYICANCGYSEEWIDTKEMRDVKNSRFRKEF